MSGGDQQHQWPRPGHGYNPDVQWYGAASTSAPGPWAAAAQGMNPYAYAPFPQFAPNPLHGVVNNLLFQNPAALTVFHQLQQQQQVQHVPSHVYHQNPSRGIQPPSANRAVSSPGQPQQKPQPQNQQVAIGKAQTAATKAREELLKSGEGVTGWKLAQAVLVALKVDSWDSLGVQLHDVPLLRDIFLIEGKVNTFIHCYVAARKIVTVHDLEVEICKNEGVEKFEELGLGPFLQHPLVVHYFAASADLSMVPFFWPLKHYISFGLFATFTNLERFCRLHISFLRQARRAEKPVRKMRESGDSSREKIFSKKSNLHTDKQALDKRFNSITSRIKQLPGINKHIHFDLTDDEVDGNSSSEDDKLDKSESKKGNSVVDSKDGDKRASSCPYPSKTEEMERLGLKSEHEAVWSFSSLSAAHEIIDSQMVEFRSTGGLNIPNHQRAPGTVSSWPPNNWNWSTAPDFRISQKSHHAYKPGAGIVSDLTMHVKGGHAEDTLVPIYLDLEAGSSSPTVDVEVANFNEKPASVPEERSLDTGTQQDASLRTGRLGEALVHKYFVEQLGSNNVKWVNQESETGLPYDIVITRNGNFTEYVEVKATVSSQKDWFYVTSREWQFALEKGDSFSFARVVLSGSKKASIEMLKNPQRLYQHKALKLALLISR